MSSPAPPPSHPASHPAPGPASYPPPGPQQWGPQHWGPQQPPPFDGLSIAGFVTSFVVPPVGFVLSLVGLVRTRRRGTRGRGLAIAGIAVGAAGTAYYALVIGVVVVAGVFGGTSHASSSPSAASGPVGDYLLAVEDLDGDTYDAYADDDLVTWGRAACTDLDSGSDVQGTRRDLHRRYDLTAPETTTVVTAAATTLCPAHAGDVPSGSPGSSGSSGGGGGIGT